MTNRPLIMKMISSLKGWNLIARATTNKDWENPELCKLEDVQSAKRLLKQQISEKPEWDYLVPECEECNGECIKYLLEIVDACFNIPDGDDER